MEYISGHLCDHILLWLTYVVLSSARTNTFAKGNDLFDVKINDVHEVLEVNF